jgi:opacity protein-like surface antigen
MKRIHFKKIVLMLSLLYTVPVFADVNLSATTDGSFTVTDKQFKPTLFQQHWYERIPLPPVITVGGGWAWSHNVIGTQYFPVVNPDTDSFYQYSNNNSWQNAGVFNIFLGDRWEFDYPMYLQAGLEYAQAGNFSAGGVLTQGADTQSQDSYNYQFNVVTRQLLVKAKVLYPYWKSVFPYLSFGLGAAFNTANNFSTTVPPFLTFTRDYSSNTQASFTYKLGVGMDFALTPHFSLGVGYEVTNYGKVQLGNATITGIPQSGTITQDNLVGQEAIMQITFYPERHVPANQDYYGKWN